MGLIDFIMMFGSGQASAPPDESVSITTDSTAYTIDTTLYTIDNSNTSV